MARYRMREKLFSFGDDYAIRDERGNDAFFVDGKMFSIGNKLSFKDMRGNELAHIRQKIIALRPSYVIDLAGGGSATVKKHLFTLFRAGFTVDVPGPGDLEATGSLLEHEYTFERGGRTVATVSKRWFSFRDSYGVDVAEGENDVLILASTVVIDLCCHPDEKHGD
ncbi:MAG TPA: LURP-one-related family protein [Tepidisphaeraceae bacterium]|nr:LURP-one-related family protein [Tepidisphaeraceae bacterium]